MAQYQRNAHQKQEYKTYIEKQKAADQAKQDLESAQNNCSITSRGLYGYAAIEQAVSAAEQAMTAAETAYNQAVTQVDTAHLFKMSAPGAVVRLETRVGAYIHAGEPLLTVWPVPEDQGRRLAEAVEISDTRAMLQDTDFAIRQLVDIGLRALSPATCTRCSAGPQRLCGGATVEPLARGIHHPCL